MSQAVTIRVGTSKGVVLLRRAADRQQSALWPIDHVTGDPATGPLWAAIGAKWEDAGVWRADGGGDTNSGSVFASADEGDSWTEIARHLRTVLSVKVLETA